MFTFIKLCVLIQAVLYYLDSLRTEESDNAELSTKDDAPDAVATKETAKTTTPTFGKVYAVAVAGNSATRKKRALQALSMFPVLEHSYSSKGAASIFFIKDNVGLPTTGTVTERTDLDIRHQDTLIVIGQNGFFRNQLYEIVDTFRGVKPTAQGPQVWLQGPGFNIFEGKAFEVFKAMVLEGPGDRSKSENFENFPAEDCPQFDPERWQNFFDHYGEPLLTLRKYALAQFWLTRYDSSFYNFCSLFPSSADFQLNFEKSIAAAMSWTQVSKALDKIDGLVAFTGKGQRGYSGWSDVFNAWKLAGIDLDNPNATHKEDLKALADVVVQKLKDLKGTKIANGAKYFGWMKEYDGYVMRRALIGKKIPDGPVDWEDHYSVIDALAQKRGNVSVKGPDSKVWCEMVAGLRKMLTKGDVYVYHDLGLDGNADDAVALMQIEDALKELLNPSVEFQTNCGGR